MALNSYKAYIYTQNQRRLHLFYAGCAPHALSSSLQPQNLLQDARQGCQVPKYLFMYNYQFDCVSKKNMHSLYQTFVLTFFFSKNFVSQAPEPGYSLHPGAILASAGAAQNNPCRSIISLIAIVSVIILAHPFHSDAPLRS